eukprot:gene409-3743_t
MRGGMVRRLLLLAVVAAVTVAVTTVAAPAARVEAPPEPTGRPAAAAPGPGAECAVPREVRES